MEACYTQHCNKRTLTSHVLIPIGQSLLRCTKISHTLKPAVALFISPRASTDLAYSCAIENQDLFSLFYLYSTCMNSECKYITNRISITDKLTITDKRHEWNKWDDSIYLNTCTTNKTASQSAQNIRSPNVVRHGAYQLPRKQKRGSFESLIHTIDVIYPLCMFRGVFSVNYIISLVIYLTFPVLVQVELSPYILVKERFNI